MNQTEPSRRDFLGGVAAAIPLVGLTLPEPAGEKNYNIEVAWVQKEDGTHLFRFGVAETWLFPASEREGTWYIRCGGVWRGLPLVCGPLSEAKWHAEQFTRETLATALVRVEKVVFALPPKGVSS